MVSNVRSASAQECAEPDFKGLRLLIAEDTAVVAAELERILGGWGCELVGPFMTLSSALQAARERSDLDGALLDINLQGETVYPVADELQKRGVPFIFLTGYARESLDDRFRNAPTLEKPFGLRELHAAIERTFPIGKLLEREDRGRA